MILLVLFTGVQNAVAQRLEDMTNYPTTPQTSSLFKAIAAPVSYYTGQPDVSIPIYTISQDGVEVPIGISFNTSGIYVTEEATSLGLGVSLNWGGSIVRSLNGGPDERGFFTDPYIIGSLSKELPKNYSNYASAICYPYCSDNPSLTELNKRIAVYHNVNEYNDPYKSSPVPISSDLRPDDFHYNVLGKSGLFKFNQANRKFVTFPLDDINIEFTPASGVLNKFEITRSDGVKIILGDGAVEYVDKVSQGYIQSWFIKKITTLKKSTIDFSYMGNQYWKSSPRNSELRIPNPPGGYESGGYDTYLFHEKLIQTINFKEGKLEFVYLNDRIDINPTETNPNLSNSGQPAPRLSQIILSDINNKKIKTFQFYQSYFAGNSSLLAVDNNRLKLDSLSITDNALKSIQKYKFEYNTSTGLPSKKSFARDHWGYYNGANSNSSLIPTTLVPINFPNNNFGTGWSGCDDLHDYYTRSLISNRFVNSTTNKIFTIKKIKFPTGGEREYIFDDNEVRWYELFSQMKDLSNDGFDVVSKRLRIYGQSLLESYPVAVESDYGKIRTVYGEEFTVQDFNEVVLGEPSFCVSTNFINPSIFINQLLSSTYEIQIGLEKKSGNVFNDYTRLATKNRTDVNLNTSPICGKFPVLLDGIYRIYVKMIMPRADIVNNWGRFGHSTAVALTFRKKNFSNIRVGGLRVREIIDRENTNEYKTTYDYTTADDYCSGHLVNIPEYKEYFATVTPSANQTNTGAYNAPYYGYRINSEPVFPLAKTQGNNVGYTNVTKKIIGDTDTIKEEFVFKFSPSLQKGYMKEYYKETEPKPWQNGKLLSNKKFRNNTLISEDDFDYYGLNNETDKGFVEEINTSLITGFVYELAGFNDDRWSLSIDRRHDNPVTYSGGNVDVGLYYFDTRSDFVIGNVVNFTAISVYPSAKIPYFKSYTGFDKLKSKTTKNYFKDGIVEESENYFYNATPTSLQLTSQTTKNSKGETLETKYFYPQDSQMASEPFVKELIAANRIAAPLNTQIFKDKNKLSEQKTIYDKSIATSNLLLPKYVLDNKGASNIAVATDKKTTFDQYSDKGNLLQYTVENGTPVSIIWGYNKTQPIAKIENATNTQIATVLGISDLNTVNETNLTAINNLRTTLPNAMVTTYTYIPLVGISTITDPKGDKITYTYDFAGRLQYVKDAQGNLLSENQYHYKNQ